MRDALKSYLALASGVTEVTRQRALEAAKALVSQGEAAAGQVSSLADDLLAQTRQNREAVAALVAYEVDRALGRVGLATADEVKALTTRVHELEAQLAAARGSRSAGTAAKQPSTKKAAPSKAPASKAPASKAPASKATGSKPGPTKGGAGGAKAPQKKKAAKKQAATTQAGA